MKSKEPRMEQRSLFDPAPSETPAEPAETEIAATASEALPGRVSLFPEDDPAVVPVRLVPQPVRVAPPPPVKVVPCRQNEWAGIADLSELKPKVLACSECPLREGARGVVFGEGDPHASIMFVGEGPGQTEDVTGKPFVGRAGQLLDQMLKTVGFERSQVFIANIVKCRPPGNRLPLPPEVEVCLPHLKAQLRIISPKMVVLLGALSSQTLVNPSIRVTRDRGKWFQKDGRSYLVTFHPAAVLRDEQGKKGQLLEDFRSLRGKWEQLQRGNS